VKEKKMSDVVEIVGTIHLQERQGVLARRLEKLAREGFHRALADVQDLDLIEGLVSGLERACAGGDGAATDAAGAAAIAVGEVLDGVPSYAEVRRLKAAEREAAAAAKARADVERMHEARAKVRADERARTARAKGTPVAEQKGKPADA
jgi:hypothetical protein